MVRTQDPHRVIRALVSFLESHREHVDPDLLRLRMLGVVSGDSAVLVPPGMRDRFDPATVHRTLENADLTITDAPFVTLDRQTGELVVEESRLDVHWAAMDELPDVGPRHRHRVIPVGRYPVRGWAFFRGLSGPDFFSPAQGVVSAVSTVIDRGNLSGQSVLDALARSIRPAVVMGIAWDLDVIVERISELLGR